VKYRYVKGEGFSPVNENSETEEAISREGMTMPARRNIVIMETRKVESWYNAVW
jgi:hypothetical protein